MTNTLDENDWEDLLDVIKAGKCTPFIGAGACAGTLPLGAEIAKQWASKYHYPLCDTEDLARVAQYLAVERYDMYPKNNIQRLIKSISPPDFSTDDEPHALLADLNLPIYITTNYDDFMNLALKSRQRDPKTELCHWNQFIDWEKPSVFVSGYTPTAANPCIYHLHGHIDLPQSIVLTEDDYLDFLVRLSTDHLTLLPPAVRTALTASSLLFVGYSLSDWNFRVLFRALMELIQANLGYTNVAVQLAPASTDQTEDSRLRAQLFLDKYFSKIQKMTCRVYWGDVKEFTKELRKRWEGTSNGN